MTPLESLQNARRAFERRDHLILSVGIPCTAQEQQGLTEAFRGVFPESRYVWVFEMQRHRGLVMVISDVE